MTMDNLPEDFFCDDLLYFKYAPISLVDVERVFRCTKIYWQIRGGRLNLRIYQNR